VRIPDEKIEEIRAATDIVELIGGFVAIKKTGKSWKGLCPFHTEKTPSFHVLPDRGIYHCFGCSRGGNAYSFLMEHEGLGFLDAVRFLADRAGIDLPKPGRAGAAESDAQDATVRANRLALEWFRANLTDAARGRVAREYLEKRGIARDAIETFAIGYATPGWDGLLTHLVRQGFEPPLLERAGLVVRSERSSGFYDRFRDRVIFPILGPTGQAIAFGGRILAEGEPKYLNSPETPIFRKGRGLFGLYANRAGIREAGEAVLVEGYTDLIALHTAGIRNVVAPLGTAFTPEQAKLLANHARRVTLLYDGDAAGRSAALRALPSLLAAGVSVRIALLPDGVDPDDFARAHGGGGVEQVLAKAAGWVAHVAADAASLGREEQARRVVEMACAVTDPITLGVHVAEAAARLTLPEATIRQGIAARRARVEGAAIATGPASAPRSADKRPVAPPSPALRIERALLVLLLREPHLLPEVERHIAAREFEDPDNQRLATALYASASGGAVPDAHALLYQFSEDPRILRIITEALAAPEEESSPAKLANDFVIKILRGRLDKDRLRLREELRVAQGREDHETQMRLLDALTENKRAGLDLSSVVRIQFEESPSLCERSHPE
jgi:DNA primase